MTVTLSSEEALQQASALLQQNRPQDALAVLRDISAGDTHFPRAQFLRGICALRGQDVEGARALLVDAVQRGERLPTIWMALARAAAATGMPDDALSLLLEGLRTFPRHALVPLLMRVLTSLGFLAKGRDAGKDKVFTDLLVPLLADLLERGDMDDAMTLENLLYQHYVKATETEAHFAWCMARIAPLFTAAGHAWRQALPPLPKPALAPPYRIGFFIHSASTLAHIEVLLNTLRGYRGLADQPFEPTVYCYSGKSPAMEAALAAIGVRLVMLNERFPDTSQWEELLRFRELLAEDGVHELVWISLVTILPLAFAMRLAPVQVWFCMKYHNFTLPEIDGYVCVRYSNRFGMMAGRRWRMARLGSDNWYDPNRSQRAAAIRAELGAKVVLMTLGRSEKMQDPAYLSAITSLLQAHPEALFLWAGREENPAVAAAFEAAGVRDQTRFIGWVDTLVYAQVGDIFLDTFPFPCGWTLVQAMAAGQAAVLYDSPESAQTGVWAHLKPGLEGDEAFSEDERAELQALIGDRDRPRFAVARTPEEYFRYASRLIEDAGLRAEAGAASQRIVEGYCSDLEGMAASLSRHFVEMIEDRAAAGDPDRSDPPAAAN